LEGDLEGCRKHLDEIELLAHDRSLYFLRDAGLTRVQLQLRDSCPDEAMLTADRLVERARHAGDALSAKKGLLAKAELLECSGRSRDALTILESVVPTLVGDSPELFAHAEQTFACAAIREGDPAGAAAHRARAARICDTIGSVTAGRLLDQQWQRARHAGPVPPADPEATAEARATARALHAIASAVAHSARPRLAADELKELLVAAACVDRATVTSGPPQAAPPASPSERFVEVGIHNDDVVGISLARKTGANAAATVTSIQILANAIRELELARAEREERATLWPVDELPIEGDASVISGHMRELMTYARKIAKTKVNVLITGESGTGKEILARAIHTFSDRAHKPFVPFNCTAIPRDLLESQLFGHRRGAFTGADRDHLGLIRSAREGTLFLDEIGELGLDLQPKLLRFLESGEIAPLGEPEPKTIDVRIIAATNTQLEDAVRAGRFREDLFYRLNVVRLSLRPLRDRRDEIPGFVHHFVRRAADEFNKGRITVTEETMERLLLYRWPGNVRQLQNEVRRIVALAEPHATITPDAIDEAILGALPVFHRTGINGSELSVSLRAKLLPTIARIECEMIKAALHEHKGRVNAVAKALGISRKGLYLKRQRFGL